MKDFLHLQFHHQININLHLLILVQFHYILHLKKILLQEYLHVILILEQILMMVVVAMLKKIMIVMGIVLWDVIVKVIVAVKQ